MTDFSSVKRKVDSDLACYIRGSAIVIDAGSHAGKATSLQWTQF